MWNFDFNLFIHQNNDDMVKSEKSKNLPSGLRDDDFEDPSGGRR